MPKIPPYNGFELGPIRPPSEAYSLLLRINRGCGWNKCRFCGFYRDVPLQHPPGGGREERHRPGQVLGGCDPEPPAPPPGQVRGGLRGPLHGLSLGAERDALRLFPGRQRPADEPGRAHRRAGVPEPDLPQIQRITTYARSDTINRLPLERLKRYRELKLKPLPHRPGDGERPHPQNDAQGGHQAGPDRGGIKAMAAGIEINEFYMPGNGRAGSMPGRVLWTPPT